MQQLQIYLTLKIIRFFNIVFFLYGYIEFDVSKSYEQPVGFFLTCDPSFHSDSLYFEMHCPANVIMMVAVVLAPNRHQCIANHHRDPSSISGFVNSHQHNIHIPLRPLNKQYLREVGSWATCCWQWVRLLTRIMLYHQFMLSTHHSHS